MIGARLRSVKPRSDARAAGRGALVGGERSTGAPRRDRMRPSYRPSHMIPLLGLDDRALAACLAVAARHGVRVTDPVVLKRSCNLVVRLAPAPIVARVTTLTRAVHPDPKANAERELSVVRHLVAVGAPVVPPSPLLPVGPHVEDDLVMTFWQEVPHDPTLRLAPDAIEPLLRGLHAKLATYPGPLPFLGPPSGDARSALMTALHHGALPVDEATFLLDLRDRLEPRLAAYADRAVPLHGDAHAGNLLVGPNGPVWIDFEETCSGPPEWDFTCLHQQEVGGWEALDELGRLLRVTRLAQAAPWYALVALRARETDPARAAALDVPGLLDRLRRERSLLFGR